MPKKSSQKQTSKLKKPVKNHQVGEFKSEKPEKWWQKVQRFIPNWITLSRVLIVLFILSRLYIWVAKPQAFSEIIYSYMPYAHLWASGTIPYRQQWYEYPPATIPLFYIPHVVDMATHPYFFHLNYSDMYRLSLLMIDTAIFVLVWKSLKRLKVSQNMFAIAILYYILLTAKAHDFIYDTMDLSFALGLVVTVAAPILLTTKEGLTTFKGQVMSWIGFWLATALKFVNAPLAPLYALLERKSPAKMVAAAVIAGALIWGLPVVLYRSSLMVSLVYHQNRGIQIDSVPSIVLRQISHFTHSEKVIEVYKNYEIAGPLTNQAKPIVTFVFVAALASFLLGVGWLIVRHPKISANWWRIHLTLGYVFVFLSTGKVLSTPFLLWHIPLLALYPFKNRAQQLRGLVPSAIIIFCSMSPMANTEIGIMNLPLLMGWIRTVCLFWLLGYWIWLTRQTLKEENQSSL